MWIRKSLLFSSWTAGLAVSLCAFLTASSNPSVVQRNGAETSTEVILAVVEPNGKAVIGDMLDRASPSSTSLLEEEAESKEEAKESALAGAHLGRELVTVCATEGGNCTCEGVVGYGKGKSRTFRRSSGTVACTGETFGKKGRSLKHNCFCYVLDWCLDKAKTGTDKTIDPAHRRRNFLGRKGQQLYQRRRWCGFGPRDCVWGSWGSWSACTGTCSESLRKRVRPQMAAAVNGGKCDSDSEGTSPCPGVASCPALADAAKKTWRRSGKGAKGKSVKKKRGKKLPRERGQKPAKKKEGKGGKRLPRERGQKPAKKKEGKGGKRQSKEGAEKPEERKGGGGEGEGANRPSANGPMKKIRRVPGENGKRKPGRPRRSGGGKKGKGIFRKRKKGKGQAHVAIVPERAAETDNGVLAYASKHSQDNHSVDVGNQTTLKENASVVGVLSGTA